MNLCDFIEELYDMLERKQSAVCNIWFREVYRITVDRMTWQDKYSHIQSASLENAIPILFQADIDQYSIIDISWEYKFSSNCVINILLARCL